MSSTSTNIDYWEKVLENPTPEYKGLIDAEDQYLKVHVPSNCRVLDIGCGNGRNIRSMTDISKQIIGVDNDPKAIEDAKKNLSSFSNVEILLADAFNLPFQDKFFDVVVLLDTLVNFEKNKAAAISEMTRVLKDTGKIIISVYSEEAFDARMIMYRKIGVPIEKTKGTTFVFSKSVGANESEQFSEEQIRDMANKAGLKVSDLEKIPGIAYICTLVKNSS